MIATGDCTRRLKSVFFALVFALCTTAVQASPITVDELLWEGDASNPTVLSGTVDMSLSGNLLTIVLKNTSTGVTADGSGSTNLLTGLAFNLPTGISISSGTVTVPGGATNVGFSSLATNVGSEWGYRQGIIDSGHWNSDGPATLGYNAVISTHTADIGVVFDTVASSLGPPPGTDGPDFGLLSSLVANSVAGGQEAIKAPLTIVLTLAGTLPGNLLDLIENAPVGISFASPDQSVVLLSTPEPGSLLLAGLSAAIAGLACRRRHNS